MAEQLHGVIEHVTFHNPENGFAVLRVKVSGRRELVTVVGTLASASAGEYVEGSGDWTQDREYGLQFKASELRTSPPHTAKGIEKFLGSGLVKGIGPHFARKIVEVFGERTLSVIDESPVFLKEVKGIGPRRIERIRNSWQEQKAVRALIVFLQGHGFGTARAVRIYQTYGDQAIELIQSNPYRLATDIWGIGFKSADQLAGRLGIDRSSPLRARAAVRYVLQQLSQEGHCGFPEIGVMEQTAALTGVTASLVQEAIEEGCQENELIRDRLAPTLESGPDRGPWLYLKPLFLAEIGVAREVRRLRQGIHPLPSIDPGRALAWVERKMDLVLAQAQREAIRQVVAQKVVVITGGPGVGKTTIVRGIIDIFSAKKLRCALCAPTGRASRRLAETTSREAKTIHRLLEFDPSAGGFKRHQHDPLDVDLVVIDETSMVDVVLMNQLLRAIPEKACLVLVGDVDQLPSVGPGMVLADIMRSQAVPVVRLVEIFRQAEQSQIVRAAHRVNHGNMPESSEPGSGDFFFVEAAAPTAILNRILTLVRERIPARFGLNPLGDIQVLTPMNRSELGASNLNLLLQEALNPAAKTSGIIRHGWNFRVGDKVLQTVNNYHKEVFNGDIGRITAIDQEEQVLTVAYEGRSVDYEFGELDELNLAFAITIHKSQGSEYPAVVIPLHTQHYLMLQRNLLYTGLTRGKKLVVLVGSRKALSAAIQRHQVRHRYTGLAWRLCQNGPIAEDG
jgi:exodeoxyribonuclease V alpha subunit